MLSGRVVTGLDRGASFTQSDWVREQFMTKLGIDPYPGTLNLIVDSPVELVKWADIKSGAGHLITPPTADWCNARSYPVRIAGKLPGAIIWPEVPNYPEAQVEVIAALPLRKQLSLADGDRLSLEIAQPISVRTVIFDVDGTLVDSVEAYRVVAERATAPHGISVTRELVCQALNYNHPSFWELVVPADHPNPAELMAELSREARRQWPEVLREYGRLFPGLGETLEALRHLGLQMAIVTGSRGDSLQPLRQAGLMDFFETVITGRDVKQRKPDPEGLRKCLDILKVKGEQAVYVGDTPIDIRAGRAAGMATVAVLSGAGDSGLLSTEGPDWLIHSHARLPKIVVRSGGR